MRCKLGKHIPIHLLRYPEVSRKFKCVHTDIVNPYQGSVGFRYIVTVVDELTKYLVPIPLKSKESLEAARHLSLIRFSGLHVKLFLMGDGSL